jgi:hypothetical protein
MIKKLLPYAFKIYFILLIISMIIPNVNIKGNYGFWIFTFRLDHWLHFSSYFGLCLLFILWRYSKINNFQTNVPFLECWWMYILAASTEIVQIIVPGRNANIKDFLCNAIGVSIGIILSYILKNIAIWFWNKKDLADKIGMKPSVVEIETPEKV